MLWIRADGREAALRKRIELHESSMSKRVGVKTYYR